MDPKIAQKAPFVRMEKAGTYTWCACGNSANQPFCDGSHDRLNTGIKPVTVVLPADRKVAWCGCKHTGTPPFCDGSHKRLP